MSVNFKENKSVTLFPNPASNDGINIKLSGYQNQEVLVVLQDMQGNEFFSRRLLISQSDNQLFAIDPQKNIPPGSIYLIVATLLIIKCTIKKIIIK